MNEKTPLKQDVVIQIENSDPEFDQIEPFIRKDVPISCYEYSKMVLMIFILPFRIFLIFILLLTFWIVSTCLSCCISPVRYSSLRGCHRDCYSVASIFMRIGLFIGGFYTIERVYSPNYKKPDKPPSTIISNHLSMLDIAFILSEFGVTSFVARGALRKYLCFGEWMEEVECLFVESGHAISNTIIKRQKKYDEDPYSTRIVIFPEGTTTNGTQIIPFKKGAFLSGSPVQPIILQHYWEHFHPTWETIPHCHYWFRLFTQFRNYLQVTYLPIYYPSEDEKKDPELYADNVRKFMSKESGIPLGIGTREDKMKYHEMIIKGKLKWDQKLEKSSYLQV